MKRKTFVLLSCLIAVVGSAGPGRAAWGQSLGPEGARQIREVIEKQIEAGQLAGVAVCIAVRGKPIFCEAFGYADCESNRKLTVDTPFQLASVSKQFAATSIMLLERDGKLKLDDNIGVHLDGLPKRWQAITIRQLLGHTSGIKDYVKFPNIRSDYQRDFERDEILKRITKHPLEFRPGSRLEYSNSGYLLIGWLIEQVSEKSYGDFLKERIFEPAGMATAMLEPIQNEDPLRAMGHDLKGKKLVHSTYNSPSWSFAAGGIVASINDLAKWDTAIDQGTILDHERLSILWTPQTVAGKKTEFGLGWKLRPAPGGKRFVMHFGNKPGFSAAVARLVEDRVSISVLSNRTHGDSSKILDEVGKALLRRMTR